MADTRNEQFSIQVREFHKRHPDVWRLFDAFTRNRIAKGFKRYSADAIMHRVRWEHDSGDPTRKDGFKINNNFVAFYARAFTGKNPEYAGFFEFRRQPSKKSQPKGDPT